jgi:hypothetical protein
MKVTKSQLRKIIREVIKESYYRRSSSYRGGGSGGGYGRDLSYYEEKYGEDYVMDVLDDLGGDYGLALSQLQGMEDRGSMDDPEDDSATW